MNANLTSYDLPTTPAFPINGPRALFPKLKIKVDGHERGKPDAWADNAVYAIPFRGSLTTQAAKSAAHAELRKRFGFLLWGGSSAGYQDMVEVIQFEGWGYILGQYRYPMGD